MYKSQKHLKNKIMNVMFVSGSEHSGTHLDAPNHIRDEEVSKFLILEQHAILFIKNKISSTSYKKTLKP